MKLRFNAISYLNRLYRDRSELVTSGGNPIDSLAALSSAVDPQPSGALPPGHSVMNLADVPPSSPESVGESAERISEGPTATVDDDWPGDAVDPGKPCTQCGSQDVWWDLLGGSHCPHCDREKRTRSRRLADRAAHLRRQNPPRPKVVQNAGSEDAGHREAAGSCKTRPTSGEEAAHADSHVREMNEKCQSKTIVHD